MKRMEIFRRQAVTPRGNGPRKNKSDHSRMDKKKWRFCTVTKDENGKVSPMVVELTITGDNTAIFEYKIGSKSKLAGEGTVQLINGELKTEAVLISPKGEQVGTSKIIIK